MVDIFIKLSHQAAEALVILAREEYRDPKQQAAFLLEKEIEQRGVIDASKSNPRLMVLKGITHEPTR